MKTIQHYHKHLASLFVRGIIASLFLFFFSVTTAAAAASDEDTTLRRLSPFHVRIAQRTKHSVTLVWGSPLLRMTLNTPNRSRTHIVKVYVKAKEGSKLVQQHSTSATSMNILNIQPQQTYRVEVLLKDNNVRSLPAVLTIHSLKNKQQR